MLGAVFMEGHGAGSGLVILLCGFLPRLGSIWGVFDPSLLFFFKSKISGTWLPWGLGAGLGGGNGEKVGRRLVGVKKTDYLYAGKEFWTPFFIL
jgi:hypothetical protein